MNIAFDEKNDEKHFHEVFDSITDMAYVEQIIPQFKPINYEKFNTNYNSTLYGKSVKPIEVCSMIFYSIQIATSGNVCPCCIDYNESVVFGNARSDHLYNIWNSKMFNNFRRIHLTRKRDSIELCKNCDYLRYSVRDEDILDDAADIIVDKIGKK